MYSKELKAIYNALQNGETFGKFEYFDYYNNIPFNYPMFHTVLQKHWCKNLLLWNHYGSSANKNTMKDLYFVIHDIFKTDPKTFIKEYITGSEYKQITQAVNYWIERGETI